MYRVIKKPTVYQYHWQGTTKTGQLHSGEITGLNKNHAIALLTRDGISIKKISKQSQLFSRHKTTIKPLDITLFTRHLSTLLNAGVAIFQALDLMAENHASPLKKIITTIKITLINGSTLAEALRQHPHCFDEFYCNLVMIGEQSGTLEVILKNLAQYREKTASLKASIKKALFYPLTVIIITFAVTAILLFFVVPQFATLFTNFGAELPLVTQWLIILSQGLQKNYLLLLCVLFMSIGMIKIIMLKNAARYNWYDVSLHLPIIGKILKNAIIARLMLTLSITLAAGLPIIDALKSIAYVSKSIRYRQGFLHLSDSVFAGESLQQAMQNTKLFPTMLLQMIKVGEASGTLDHLLHKTADFLSQEVDNAVANLSSLIEPLLIIILGLIIGTLMIAMYLPIFKLGNLV